MRFWPLSTPIVLLTTTATLALSSNFSLSDTLASPLIAPPLSSPSLSPDPPIPPSLPPADDIPEEVLRTEIITDARSPLTGEPLSAAEYAELQAQLDRDPQLRATLPTQLRELIFLLQFRRTVRTIAPFLLK